MNSESPTTPSLHHSDPAEDLPAPETPSSDAFPAPAPTKKPAQVFDVIGHGGCYQDSRGNAFCFIDIVSDVLLYTASQGQRGWACMRTPPQPMTDDQKAEAIAMLHDDAFRRQRSAQLEAELRREIEGGGSSDQSSVLSPQSESGSPAESKVEAASQPLSAEAPALASIVVSVDRLPGMETQLDYLRKVVAKCRDKKAAALTDEEKVALCHFAGIEVQGYDSAHDMRTVFRTAPVAFEDTPNGIHILSLATGEAARAGFDSNTPPLHSHFPNKAPRLP